MAEVIPQSEVHEERLPQDPLGRFLFGWSKLSALGGALLLFAACVLSVYSVLGRWLFDEPVLGDVEMVQMACALAIAACLPYAQMKNAHVIVDFFTLKAPASVRAVLDRLAALILAVGSLVIAWRSFVGAWEAYASEESTMILGWPLWWSYLTLGPGFLLLALTALHTAWKGTSNNHTGDQS